jgi:hypothetical protein
METVCSFICTNNNAKGCLIRLLVNMKPVRKVDRKKELKREWKKGVEINQSVKEEKRKEIREIK